MIIRLLKIISYDTISEYFVTLFTLNLKPISRCHWSLKISGFLMFSWGYRKRSVAWNGDEKKTVIRARSTQNWNIRGHVILELFSSSLDTNTDLSWPERDFDQLPKKASTLPFRFRQNLYVSSTNWSLLFKLVIL